MGEFPYKLKLLEKVSEILQCFDSVHSKLTFTEILKLKPHLDRTAIYRILMNLHELKFLEINSDDNSFTIGTEIYRLAHIGIHSFELRDVIQPFLKQLRNATKETVIVNVIQNHHGVCIERVHGTHAISITANTGRIVPLLRGASGKILAAHLPTQELEEIYNEEKEFLNGKTFDDLLAEMGRIRTRGFDISFAELDSDTAGVSFPIFNSNGEVIAGLSVIGPIFRFSPNNLDDIIYQARVCASEISKKIKYIY